MIDRDMALLAAMESVRLDIMILVDLRTGRLLEPSSVSAWSHAISHGFGRPR